jgi:hypothetical protein
MEFFSPSVGVKDLILIVVAICFPKRQCLITELHGVTTQKLTVIIITGHTWKFIRLKALCYLQGLHLGTASGSGHPYTTTRALSPKQDMAAIAVGGLLMSLLLLLHMRTSVSASSTVSANNPSQPPRVRPLHI